MKRKLVLFLFLLSPILMFGQSGETLLYFNFTDTTKVLNTTPVIVNEGIESGAIGVTGLTLITSPYPMKFEVYGWPTDTILNPNKYVEISITPKTDQIITVTRIEMRQISQTAGTDVVGPKKMFVRSSRDNYATDIYTFLPQTSVQVTIPVNYAGQVNESISFRIYGIKADTPEKRWVIQGHPALGLGKELTIFGNSAPLPVELTQFTAVLNKKSIELKWQTATEINNYGFSVQRKSSGEKIWKEREFIYGHGNSNSVKNYSYIDSNVEESNKYTYRLKQIDNSGTFEYSKEIEVAYYLPVIPVLKQNYPNPFNPVTYINYSIPEEGYVTLRVYNLLGQEAAVLANGMEEAGAHTTAFDGKDLSSGFYIYELQFTGASGKRFSEIKKMTLLK